MADPVVLKLKFKELGESLGLAGAELITYINTEFDQHVTREERARERELKREEMLVREREAERNEREREKEAERKEREKEAERKEREAERAEREREAEREERERARAHDLEMQRLASLAERLDPNNSPPSTQVDSTLPTHSIAGMNFPLSPFNEKEENLDLYLDRFERMATEFQLPEKHWAIKISYALRGKAYDLYSKLPTERACDYKQVKETLLKGFQLTGECYRKKFRSCRREKAETFSQFAVRIAVLFDKWVTQNAPTKTYDTLTELLLCEQIRETMSPELRTFVAEQGAESLQDLILVADRYLAAHSEAKSFKHDHTQNGRDSNHPSPTHEHKPKPGVGTQNKSSLAQNAQEKANKNSAEGKRYCTHCKKTNHTSENCFKLAGKRRRDPETNLSNQVVSKSDALTPGVESHHPSVTETCTVNGILVKCLYDTGLSYDAIVKRTLVSPEMLTGETIDLQGADTTSPPITCPIVLIDVTSRYVTGRIKAAVLDQPLYELILGCRYVFLGNPHKPLEVAAVQTRAQAKETENSAQILNPLPAEIKAAQKNDTSLEKCFNKLNMASQPPKKRDYVMIDGILHRQGDQDHTQLVLPVSYRQQVLELGHSMPLSGHMGITATVQRIGAHYWWPGITQDIRRYVKSCHQCQRFAPRHHTVPVTIGPSVVVGVPFQKVAVDIVGPLPLTKKKNRFLLTLVDACTMWCEAIPLPSIDSKKVADALISIFTRVGFPDQIKTDNGSQFTGRLMQEVFGLLQVHHIRTPPYHPASNGQVERLNGTLMAMLRKVADEKPEAWDTYIPAALFAYRETPHSSTGYTPSTLLFGRPLSGPLEALRKSWTDAKVDDTPKEATKYVTDLQEKLKTTWATASEALKKARNKQAKHFNRHAKDRELLVGDQVLLLLQSGTNKLNVAWQGPYPVIAKSPEPSIRLTCTGSPVPTTSIC